jgi:hypothetical protein
MMQTVNEADHRGVKSYWLDQQGLCTGTLIFGVGKRDESAALAGITHLIEHIVLRKVQPVTVRHGASVDTNTTEFHASGRPEAVAGFLNAVAEAISNFSDLSEQDLVLEKAGIQAENPREFHQVSAGLLTNRFGPAGPGTGHFGAPGTTGFSMDETIDWTKRWFTSANAALTFTGPIPGSLNIRLPSGGIVVRDQPVPVINAPTLIRSSRIGVALSLVVSTRYAVLLAEALAYELHRRLDHDLGLIYSVEKITTLLNDGSVQLDLVLDPIEDNTVQTLQGSLETLRQIAASDFSQDAIECARQEYEADMAWDERVPMSYLDQVAVDGLFQIGTPTRQELLDHAMGITSADLTEILKVALESLIVAVDREVKLRKKDAKNLGLTVDSYEIWQVHAEAPLSEDAAGKDRRQWQSKSRKTSLQLTDTHLVKHRPGKTKAIKLDDVALVGDRSCGCVALMDKRGRSTEIDVDQWKNSKKLRKALLNSFPTEIIRPFPEE